LRAALERLAREPLVHFLSLGLLLYVVATGLDSGGALRTESIVVDRDDVARLAAQWEAQYGDPPSAAQIEALIESHVRDEILYREALALGLERDDLIIRRRLIQKLRFLDQGWIDTTEPTEQELADFHAMHLDRYTQPAKTSFQHVYFSGDQRGEAARDAALAALDSLRAGPREAGSWRSLGDPFMLQREYASRDDREIAELFGVDFASALARIEPGNWAGPVPSSYGWHAVRVRERRPEVVPELSEIRDRVLADYDAQRRTEREAQQLEELRRKYEVRILDGFS
jgi:hypothetical protein